MADAAPANRIRKFLASLLTNGCVGTIIRVGLGIMFLVASIEKIADPNAFAQSIGNYKILSPAVTIALASTLPWIELLCGMALLFGIATRGSALVTSIMLLCFTVAVVSALVRGLDISCGCFTQDPQAGKVAWEKVIENSIMIIAALSLVFMPTTRLSLESFLCTHTPDADPRT